MWQYRIAMKAIPQFVLCMLLATCLVVEAVAKGASPATNGLVASINDHFKYHASGRSIPALIAPLDTPELSIPWMEEAEQYGIWAYPADPDAPFRCRWAGFRPEAPSPSMVCPCPECSARRHCQYSLPACPCSACSTPYHTACRQAVRQHELERLLEILIRNLQDDAPPPDQVERPDQPAGDNEKAPGATNTGGQSSIHTP
jgi:hypothetical protein